MLIINGPAVQEAGVACGFGALGYGHRANLTIGRAVRLCLWRLAAGWKTGLWNLWIDDGMSSDPMVLAVRILAGTERLQVALGVANIYLRDPTMTVGAQYGLNEQWGGRFLLGMGISHPFSVEGNRT